MKLQHVKNIFKDESGATAIEYGLIAALISIAAITAISNVGTSLGTFFNSVDTSLTTNLPATEE